MLKKSKELKKFKNDFDNLTKNDLSFNDVKDKIVYKSETIKEKPVIINRYRKLVISFMTLIIVAFAITGLVLLINSGTEENKPDNGNSGNNNDLIFNTKEDNLNFLIYNGAKRVLNEDKSSIKIKVNDIDSKLRGIKNIIKLDNEESSSAVNEIIRYPFTNIEISNPIAFSIMRLDNNDYSFLEDKIGYGEIEVIICGITLYEDEYSYPHETMIIFATPESVYSCLTNGGSYRYDAYGNRISSTYDFSPHKFIDGQDIVKTDEKKHIEVTISATGEVSNLVIIDWDRSEPSARYSYVEDTYREIKALEMFSISDLMIYIYNVLDLEIIDVFVVEDAVMLEVIPISGYNVKMVLVNNATESIEGDVYEIGDIVKITYAVYYEKYNPQKLQALKIEINEKLQY